MEKQGAYDEESRGSFRLYGFSLLVSPVLAAGFNGDWWVAMAFMVTG